MKRIICDQCRTATEPDVYGLPPTGWITVTARRDVYEAPKDFCSPACAAGALVAQAAPAAAKTEAIQ